MIEHWSNTLLSVEEMRPPCCSVDVSNGSSAQLQDDIHIPEVYVQDKHALMQTRFGHSRQTEAAPSCSIVSCKETWSHLHFQALLFFFFYLLGGERLRPVVQNEPVFVEGFGLCRRFFALLPVCDFAVFIHGWDGPPATVGRGNMVGRRHDRAFCACGGEERGGRGWRESVCERERERASEQERERERKLSGSSAAASPVHAAAATASISLGQLRASQGKNTHTLIHMQIPTYSSMPLYLQLNRWVTVLHHMMRYAQTCAVETPRRERFSGRSIGSCKDNGGCGPRYARKFSLCGA